MRKLLLAAAMLTAISPWAGADAHDSKGGLSRLTKLVGTWRIADRPDSTLRIRFELTAGRSVLVESWERAGRPHSLTVYHRDGNKLIATHYCPQGNQPRLAHRLAPATPNSANPQIDFNFVGVSDLDAGESHLRSLRFDLSVAGRVTREEVYRGSSGDESSLLVLVRDVPSS